MAKAMQAIVLRVQNFLSAYGNLVVRDRGKQGCFALELDGHYWVIISVSVFPPRRARGDDIRVWTFLRSLPE